MNFEEKKTFLLNLTYFSVILTIIFFTVKFMLSYLMPFIIGLIIAYIVQKPSRIISEKVQIKQGYCAALFAVFLYLLIIIIILLLGWSVYSNGNHIIEKVGNFFSVVTEGMDDISIWIKNLFGDLNAEIRNTFIAFITDYIKGISSTITNILTSFLGGIIKNLPAFFVTSAVTVVASCYIAKDYNLLAKFLYNLINKEKYNNVLLIKEIITKNILKLTSGYLILMIITFLELLIGFLCLGVKHSFFVAIIVSLVDLLPVLGTGTVLLPWAVLSFFSDDISKGVGLVILYLIVCFVRNFSEPKIIGKKMGVNPLFTLVSMFVGIKVAGIAGLFVFPLVLIVVIEYYKIQLNNENWIET